MCRFQIGEDDSLTSEDFSRSIGNGIERVDTRIQTQIAILEQRIARVEAQMESVKDSLFRLQMSVCILGVILWVTLAFVILKWTFLGDYELLNVEIHSWVSDYMHYDSEFLASNDGLCIICIN